MIISVVGGGGGASSCDEKRLLIRKTTSNIMPIIMTRGIITSKSVAYDATVDVCSKEGDVPPVKDLRRLGMPHDRPQIVTTAIAILRTIPATSITIVGIAAAVSLILRGAGK